MARKSLKAFPWFGGKYTFLDYILPLIGEHQVYYEPFMGSASVLLNKKACAKEYISDLDTGMVNLMQCLADKKKMQYVRGRAFRLWEDARAQGKSEEDIKREFDCARERIKAQAYREQADFAVDVYMGIAYSFNALRKSYVKNKRNPFGNCDLQGVNERLQGVSIEHKNAFEVLGSIRGGSETFVFLDPPYREALMGSKGVYQYSMPDEKQEEMLNIIKNAEYRVMLCGYRDNEEDFYDKILKTGRHQKLGDVRRWRCYHLADAKAPSCKDAAERRTLSEFIWVNYDLPVGANKVIRMEEYGNLL